MNVLITGGLSNLGLAVISELSEKDINVSVLDVKNKKNKKRYKKNKNLINKIFFNDNRSASVLSKAISDCNCIIYMGNDESIQSIGNLINEINNSGSKSCLICISTSKVMGPTQAKKPPIKTSDKINCINGIIISNVNKEKEIISSGIRHSILRLTYVLDTSGDYNDDMMKILYEHPLDGRIEVILDLDAAAAIVNASISLLSDNVINKKTFFIGGGKANGCQIYNRTLINGILSEMGIGMIDENCFLKDLNNYCFDWYDTEKSNELLKYQNHSFNDYLDILRIKTKNGGPVVKYLAPKIRATLEKESPYLKK